MVDMQPLQSVQPVQSAQPDNTAESTLFMTADEAAKLLGYSPEHVRRCIKKRLIPGIKVGDSYRVFRSFIQRIVAEMEAGRFVDFDDFAVAPPAAVSEAAS